MEIIAKPNSHNYWLILTHNSNATIDLYEISSSGINFISNQSMGSTLTDIQGMRYNEQNGKMVFLSLVENEPVALIDFDPTSGSFSNPSTLIGTPMGSGTQPWTGMYDVEFSPDGSKMYISKLRGGSPSTGGKLFQYDFNNPSIPPVLIYDVGSSTSKMALGLETGPDEKIYFCHVNSNGEKRYLSYIDSPNLSGSSCNFVPEAIDMGLNLGSETNIFPRFYKMINSIPGISDSTINYSTVIPGLVTIDILSGYSDDESDNLSMNIINSVNGNANVNGGQIEFTVLDGCLPANISVEYCDDFCYSNCDTFEINLIPTEPQSDSISVYECQSYTVPSGDETYYVSGFYQDTIQNYYGCDSLINIYLTIGNVVTEIDEFACDRYTVPSGNATYSQDGQYTDTLQSVSGCDSILIINLSFSVLDTTISLISDTLHSNMDSASYQWISCVSGLALTSETNQDFVPVSNGYYAVVVTTDDGCSDTSGCYTIGNVSMEKKYLSDLKIYPNPSRDNLTIEAQGEFDMELRTMTGQIILNRSFKDKITIDLKEESRGIYVVILKNQEGIQSEKIILE